MYTQLEVKKNSCQKFTHRRAHSSVVMPVNRTRAIGGAKSTGGRRKCCPSRVNRCCAAKRLLPKPGDGHDPWRGDAVLPHDCCCCRNPGMGMTPGEGELSCADTRSLSASSGSSRTRTAVNALVGRCSVLCRCQISFSVWRASVGRVNPNTATVRSADFKCV